MKGIHWVIVACGAVVASGPNLAASLPASAAAAVGVAVQVAGAVMAVLGVVSGSAVAAKPPAAS